MEAGTEALERLEMFRRAVALVACKPIMRELGIERHHDAIVICLAVHGADPDHNHIRCGPLAVDKIPTPPE